MCSFPDGSTCEEWDFLTGKCGNEYSYCERNGYGIKTVSQGEDAFTNEYAVCTSSEGEIIGPVSVLSGLVDRLSDCEPEDEPDPGHDVEGNPPDGSS
jgi:putative hemolysin